LVRKTNPEDRSFMTFDEPVADKPKILAAIEDAEKRDLFEYGVLTSRFFMIIQNGMINTCINRTSFAATKPVIEKILSKLERELPKDVYEIVPFA